MGEYAIRNKKGGAILGEKKYQRQRTSIFIHKRKQTSKTIYDEISA
jgi:hypothetical protein